MPRNNLRCAANELWPPGWMLELRENSIIGGGAVKEGFPQQGDTKPERVQ